MFMMNISFVPSICSHKSTIFIFIEKKSTHFLTTTVKNLTFALSPTLCVCLLRERERTVSFPRPAYSKKHVSTPNWVRIFRFMIALFSLFCFVLGFFLRMHHQSIKTKKCQRTIFLSYIFLRTVCELTFSIKQMHYKTGTLWHSDASILFTSANVVLDKGHWDAFILLTSAKVPSASAKVVLDKRPYKISSKAMHRVCCFHWCRHVISWTADVWSELVSLVSCILPPLPRFRAVTCYRPLCLQTRHMWRWLTSVKLRMQSRCSLV